MDGSWVRAVEATRPDTLNDMRLTSCHVVLLVTAPGCANCAAFETERWDRAEEKVLSEFRGARLTQWHCSTEERKALAVKAGVTDVPALLVLPPLSSSEEVRVVDAMEFAK